ncbi:MAG: sulfate adenylyltransferase [Alphaproteobacteria bacterium]|nr:sulfate adenylyltransferase [Alphaproteobacteria bacterium]
MSELVLTPTQYLELEKLALGAFAPVEGFMNEEAFASVVDTMRLPDGTVFPLPITLAVDRHTADRLRGLPRVALVHGGEEIGTLIPESCFTCDKQAVADKVFGTADVRHPGVAEFYAAGDHMLGGAVQLHRRVSFAFSDYELSPADVRRYVRARGWRRVVGFQTRDVPHRAHEYLQRVALEQADALFIQPLVGRKKLGDYTPAAIIAGYRTLIDRYYPKGRVIFGILSTFMRYAGPREAVFHAIIRRNYGCSHFIVGRDHAGVGSYYGAYEAHALLRRLEGELGIAIMPLCGPYHCARCDGVVTEHTCPHRETEPAAITEISGTDMRALLAAGRRPDARFMRLEVVDSLRNVPLFIEEDAAA